MIFEGLEGGAWKALRPSTWGHPIPKEEVALQDLIQALVPRQREERDPELDPDTLEQLFRSGLFSLTVPTDCGGCGAAVPSFVRLMEWVGRLGPAWAITAVPHLCISVSIVDRLARPSLRRDVLGSLRTDRRLLAFAITEDAGSDLAALCTTLREDDAGRLILRGRKQWVTNLRRASHIAVAARCPQMDPVPGAAIFALIPRTASGLQMTQPWEKLEANGSDTGDLFLDDVHVEPEWLLGAPGTAFKHFSELVLPGRLGAGAAAVGMAVEALDRAALDEVETSIPRSELVQMLAGARASLAWAAHLVAEGDPYRAAAVAFAKDLAGRAAQEVADVVDLGYARTGRPSPACVARACGAMGLFRLLKGPGEVLSIQAAIQVSARLERSEGAPDSWPATLEGPFRRLRTTIQTCGARPEGRNQCTMLALGQSLAYFQALLAQALDGTTDPSPFLDRMHEAMDLAERRSLGNRDDDSWPDHRSAAKADQDEDEADLTRELLQQAERIVRKEADADSPVAREALEALGLLDPHSLPPSCRRAVFQRLGEKAPALTRAAWLPRDLDALQPLRLGLLIRLQSQAREHAESRIMFRRPLIQQPSIALRLRDLRRLAALAADAGSRPLGALEQAIRNECQQIAGGTGYMAESPLAQTVQALRTVDGLLRPLEAGLPTSFPELQSIERAIS